MTGIVLPRVQAMIFCDHIEESAEEGVFNLLGIRTRIRAPAFPYVHPQLWIYLQMTGHEGTISGVVVVQNARTDDMVIEEAIPPISLYGPLDVTPVNYLIEDCEFLEPGVYYVQLYSDQKLLFERPLHLEESLRNTNGSGAN